MSIIPGAKAPSRPLGDEPAIHPSAEIHPSAIIGEGARIGPGCVIGPRVRIGPGCVLHHHVSVMADTVMGADNVIFPFAVVGADPQDLKYQGERTQLIIGDANVIREHATIHRGTGAGGGRTTVGSDCLFMVGVHVAHDCIIEDEVIMANGAMLGGHCHVEFGATIAGAAAVHHFTTIGRLAFVGGMARIAKDVPPYLVVEGNPAEPRKINTTAMQRRKWAEADIEAMKTAYKRLFRLENGPMQQTMAQIRAEEGAPEPVLKLCDFLERMTMGVHGRWRETLRTTEAARHAIRG